MVIRTSMVRRIRRSKVRVWETRWWTTIIKVWREHVRWGRWEIPRHSVGRAKEMTRRSIRMWWERHSHVMWETSSGYELHLIDPLLLTPLILKPDLDNSHWEPSILS